MAAIDTALDRLGRWLARRITQRPSDDWPHAPSDPEALRRTLKPADVLLVSGSEKVSTAIKYLTQSTWSHAALYVGPVTGKVTETGEPHVIVEVNLGEGCVCAPLTKYTRSHTRICRPVALTADDRRRIVAFMLARIGTQYDLRNVLDLARYLIPTPPIPVRWRRRMISLGSGEPTRAICSSMIAEAFQTVRYPILPRVERVRCQHLGISQLSRAEILHIRHHSLYAPGDFDVSPYFDIVKPTIEEGFNYKGVTWADQVSASPSPEPGDLFEIEPRDREGQARRDAAIR